MRQCSFDLMHGSQKNVAAFLSCGRIITEIFRAPKFSRSFTHQSACLEPKSERNGEKDGVVHVKRFNAIQ